MGTFGKSAHLYVSIDERAFDQFLGLKRYLAEFWLTSHFSYVWVGKTRNTRLQWVQVGRLETDPKNWKYRCLLFAASPSPPLACLLVFVLETDWARGLHCQTD